MKKMNAIGMAIGTMVLGMGVAMAQAQAPAAAGSAPAAAGAKKAPNVAKNGKASSESASAVEAVAAAEGMVRYGDAAKDPVALIAAARVLKNVGTQESKAERVGGKPGDAKNKANTMSVEAILARAKALANGRQDIVAMADDVAKEGTRGAVGGPAGARTVVRSRDVDSFRVTFRGGVPARVDVSGDGDSDLDLFIYDQYGNRVCTDDDATDQLICGWTPRETGPFTIRVRNLGVANEYVIRHN
jgi:hypothetical protein